MVVVVVVVEIIRLTIHRLVRLLVMVVVEEARDRAQDTAVATLMQDLVTMALEAIPLHHVLPQDLLDDPRMATIVHREGLRTLTVQEDRPLLLVLWEVEVEAAQVVDEIHTTIIDLTMDPLPIRSIHLLTEAEEAIVIEDPIHPIHREDTILDHLLHLRMPHLLHMDILLILILLLRLRILLREVGITVENRQCHHLNVPYTLHLHRQLPAHLDSTHKNLPVCCVIQVHSHL